MEDALRLFGSASLFCGKSTGNSSTVDLTQRINLPHSLLYVVKVFWTEGVLMQEKLSAHQIHDYAAFCL